MSWAFRGYGSSTPPPHAQAVHASATNRPSLHVRRRTAPTRHVANATAPTVTCRATPARGRARRARARRGCDARARARRSPAHLLYSHERATSERFRAPRGAWLPEPRNLLEPPAAAQRCRPPTRPCRSAPHGLRPQWLEPQAAHGRARLWLNSRSRCARCRGPTVGSRSFDPVALV